MYVLFQWLFVLFPLVAVLCTTGFLPRALVKYGELNRNENFRGLTPVFLSSEEQQVGRYEEYPAGLMNGKVCLVTGGNSGLGFVTAKQLALKGCAVTIASRRPRSVAAACLEITKAVKDSGSNGSCDGQALELSSLKNVDAFAKKFVAEHERLDVVVLNAGINQYWLNSDIELSEDGIELQFATNHLGHYALMKELLPLVSRTGAKTGDARIVVVSSNAHYFREEAPFMLTLKDLNSEMDYSAGAWYANSKYANILMSNYLASTTPNYVRVNSVHPGVVRTVDVPLRDAIVHFKENYPILEPVLSPVLHLVEKMLRLTAFTPEEGARTQFWLAASPEISEKEINGKYFHPHKQKVLPARKATSSALSRQLITFSDALISQSLKK